MRQSGSEMKARHDGRRVFRVLSALCGGYFLWVLGVVVFGQTAYAAAYQTNMLASNLLLLPFVLLLLLGLWAIPARTGGPLKFDIRSNGALAGWFAALLIVQLLVAHSLWFYPGWDVESVYQAAFALAESGAVEKEYFALCPNNAALAMLLSVPLTVAARLGKDVPYTVLVYLSELLVNLSCLLAMLCVRTLTKSRAAWMGALLLCTGWIALSLIATVPYTDSFAVLFPVLALYVYLRKKLPPFAKWLLIAFICFAGSAIKPTALILLLAMALVLGVRTLLTGALRTGWKRVLVIITALALGAAGGILLQRAAVAYMSGEVVPQAQLSETHYLMLGMNGDSLGGHTDADVAYSTSFATLSERRQASLARAWERLSSRSFAENLTFFSAKLYKAFGDGTMAQSKSFLVMEQPARTGWWAALLQQVYFTDGRYNALFQTVQQVFWLFILLLMPVAMFGKSGNQKVTAVLAVTLTGLGMYLMLFEVWPRYLYLYSPVFVVLAAIGIDTLRRRVSRWWPRRTSG